MRVTITGGAGADNRKYGCCRTGHVVRQILRTQVDLGLQNSIAYLSQIFETRFSINNTTEIKDSPKAL